MITVMNGGMKHFFGALRSEDGIELWVGASIFEVQEQVVLKVLLFFFQNNGLWSE
jgi:hypothetical protein